MDSALGGVGLPPLGRWCRVSPVGEEAPVFFVAKNEEQMDLRRRLLDALEPHLAEDGAELVDVKVQVKGQRRTICLLVDQPGGVNIDDCARISRRLEDILDAQDLIPFHYVLEVSSPGLDRPLRKPHHYERFVGERVRIRMVPEFGDRRQFSGTLAGLDEGNVLVVDESGDECRLPLDRVHSARVQIDPWKRKDQPE